MYNHRRFGIFYLRILTYARMHVTRGKFMNIMKRAIAIGEILVMEDGSKFQAYSGNGLSHTNLGTSIYAQPWADGEASGDLLRVDADISKSQTETFQDLNGKFGNKGKIGAVVVGDIVIRLGPSEVALLLELDKRPLPFAEVKTLFKNWELGEIRKVSTTLTYKGLAIVLGKDLTITEKGKEWVKEANKPVLVKQGKPRTRAFTSPSKKALDLLDKGRKIVEEKRQASQGLDDIKEVTDRTT